MSTWNFPHKPLPTKTTSKDIARLNDFRSGMQKLIDALTNPSDPQPVLLTGVEAEAIVFHLGTKKTS